MQLGKYNKFFHYFIKKTKICVVEKQNVMKCNKTQCTVVA